MVNICRFLRNRPSEYSAGRFRYRDSAHVARFRARGLAELFSRPDGPPDPVATGDMPWARGGYSYRGGNGHASECSQSFGRASVWKHWARLKMWISDGLAHSQTDWDIIAQNHVTTLRRFPHFKGLLEKVP